MEISGLMVCINAKMANGIGGKRALGTPSASHWQHPLSLPWVTELKLGGMAEMVHQENLRVLWRVCSLCTT